jgi:hypothetical protein
MENDGVFDKIIELAKMFPGAVSYQLQEQDKKRIYKYIGKFMCPVDDDHLAFLLKFNNVKIFDWTFLGMGDIHGRKSLYELTTDNWQDNTALVPYFLSFATSGAGEIIGSMTNYKGSKKFPVGYLHKKSAKEFLYVGSGFQSFLINLLRFVETSTADVTEVERMNRNHKDYIFAAEDAWTREDLTLRENLEKAVYIKSADDNWKLEFNMLK